MTFLFNTAFKALLVKEIDDWVDWNIIEEDWKELTWKPNINNTISEEMFLLNKEKYKEFNQKIISECKEFLNHTAFVSGMYDDLLMTNSWANITEPGHEHHEHVHPFSIVSGVIYLDDNPSNTNLFVESFIPDVPHFLPTQRNYANVGALIRDAQIDPASKNNLKHYMVLFLSNSHHYVGQVDEGLPNRRSISFNTFWKGHVGSKEDLGSHTF